MADGFRPRPMLDVTCKALFGRESKKELLLSLLNAVLEHPGFVDLVDVVYLNPALEYETVGEKHPSLDVRVRDKSGRQFNVEVQLAEQKTWPQRLLYYWAKMYAHQLKEGEEYKRLHPAICVAFLGFELDKREGYMRRILPWDQTHGVVFSEHLDLFLFEMPKFSAVSEVPSKREQWLQFLKEGHVMPSEVVEKWKTPEILEAIEELKKLSEDRAWREEYNDREKGLRDFISMMKESFEEGIEKGLQEGIEKGLQEGIEKGLQEGLEKGLQEGLEKGLQEGLEKGLRKAVARLLKSGMTEEEVAEFLELPREKVERLAAG